MVDSVKGGAEVEKEEDVKGARIRGKKEVVGDFQKSHFSAGVGMEIGFESFKELAYRWS